MGSVNYCSVLVASTSRESSVSGQRMHTHLRRCLRACVAAHMRSLTFAVISAFCASSTAVSAPIVLSISRMSLSGVRGGDGASNCGVNVSVDSGCYRSSNSKHSVCLGTSAHQRGLPPCALPCTRPCPKRPQQGTLGPCCNEPASQRTNALGHRHHAAWHPRALTLSVDGLRARVAAAPANHKQLVNLPQVCVRVFVCMLVCARVVRRGAHSVPHWRTWRHVPAAASDSKRVPKSWVKQARKMVLSSHPAA